VCQSKENLKLKEINRITNNATKVEVTYSGKMNGLTFEKFDDLVVRWGRKKWVTEYANALWQNELIKIGDLDLTDDLDYYTFETHCEMMFCYLEEITSGEAARQLLKRGVGQMSTMRRFFFERFGAGQPEVLAERAKHYLLGMLDKDGEVFPPKCNMEIKLDKLETAREFLLEMCPKDKRDTYDTGKETTLVRIVLRTIPQEYDQAVKSVRDLTKLRKYGVMGDLTQITNKEDNTRTHYDDEWLPPYDELRIELIDSYQLQERRRKELGKSIRKHPGHPVLPILPGHEQSGPHQRNCYGCGELGHLSSDPICKAGPNDVWKGAPAAWKARRGDDGRRRGFGKGKGKGKGGGNRRVKGKGRKSYQRNLGDRKPQPDGVGKKNEIIDQEEMGSANMGPTAIINMRDHKEERREEPMRHLRGLEEIKEEISLASCERHQGKPKRG
jgi:hypothetical protein